MEAHKQVVEMAHNIAEEGILMLSGSRALIEAGSADCIEVAVPGREGNILPAGLAGCVAAVVQIEVHMAVGRSSVRSNRSIVAAAAVMVAVLHFHSSG